MYLTTMDGLQKRGLVRQSYTVDGRRQLWTSTAGPEAHPRAKLGR